MLRVPELCRMAVSAYVATRCILLFTVLASTTCSRVEVLFVDVARSAYISAGNPQTSLDSQGLATAVHGLLSTTPSFRVSQAVSRQVEDLLVPNVLSRPKAVISMQIPGLQLGPAVDQYLLGLGPVKAYKFTELAEKVFNSISTVVGTGVRHVAIDHRAFASCNDDCAEQQLQALLPVISANYTPCATGPLRGTLFLPVSEGNSAAVKLDLHELSPRLLAVELANVLQAAVDAGQAAKSGVSGATLYDGSLLSLQSLVHQYGKTSQEAQAATLAVVKAVAAAVERFSLAFDGQVVLQLGSLGDIPLDNMKELMNWRDTHTRRILAEASPTPGDTSGMLPAAASGGGSTEWETYAAQILVVVLLVVFSLGSVYTMLYMKYKRDTLLYARAKAE